MSTTSAENPRMAAMGEPALRKSLDFLSGEEAVNCSRSHSRELMFWDLTWGWEGPSRGKKGVTRDIG